MAKRAPALSVRVIKGMMEYTQPKLQTSLQYTKRNLIPLAKTKIPEFTYGTSRLLRDITRKTLVSLAARSVVAFVQPDSGDSSEYKRLVELLEKVVAMMPVDEIKELCAGLDISSTSFVMFLKSFKGPKVENIVSKIEDIPGIKEMHEFLKAKGIDIDVMMKWYKALWKDLKKWNDDNMIENVLEMGPTAGEVFTSFETALKWME